jgi:hypothetical protein
LEANNVGSVRSAEILINNKFALRTLLKPCGFPLGCVNNLSLFLLENTSAGHLIFFLLPVGIQISINVVLFVTTAVYCNRVKAEIHRMQMIDNCEQKKKRYIADKAM